MIWSVLTVRHLGNSDGRGTYRHHGVRLATRLIVAYCGPARRRRLANVSFRWIDLNNAAARAVQPGNLVICLETLEHVGNTRVRFGCFTTP